MRALLAALALAACSATPPPFADGTRTLLSGEAASALEHQCSRVSPGPSEMAWAPTDADIAEMEPALGATLAAELTRIGYTALPRDYYRQYAGMIVGGRRIIYVNGVHRDAIERQRFNAPGFDWRKDAVQICDGGPITFGVEYDPMAKTFARFAFNGAVG